MTLAGTVVLGTDVQAPVELGTDATADEVGGAAPVPLGTDLVRASVSMDSEKRLVFKLEASDPFSATESSSASGGRTDTAPSATRTCRTSSPAPVAPSSSSSRAGARKRTLHSTIANSRPRPAFSCDCDMPWARSQSVRAP